MRTVLIYLSLMAALSLPGILVWLIFLPMRRHHRAVAGLRPGKHYEAALLLFFMFMAGLLGLTLTPSDFWPALMRGELPALPPAFQGGLNLEPFHVSWALLKFYAEHGLWGALLVNFPGNIVIFIPVGFFSALFTRRPSWWKSAGAGALLSLLIEISQLFISRGTDIDDLILNTLGGLLGFFIFRAVNRSWPQWVKSCSRF